MQMKLKKKYTTWNEPDKWKGKAGPKYRNAQQYGVGGSRSGSKGQKHVTKPLGFSGRTLGAAIRKHSPHAGKKK